MLKKLFSRLPIIALTIILLFIAEVALVVGLGYALTFLIMLTINAEFTLVWGIVIMQAVSGIIVLLTVIHAANRDMVPETKLPWILCIVALGIFGVAIYLTFSSPRPGKKSRKRAAEIYACANRYESGSVPEERLEKEMHRWSDVSEALQTCNPSAVVYEHTKTEYFPVGEAFRTQLIEDLNRAEKYIFMEYFIIKKGEFWGEILEILTRKAKEGVEVRFMYDDIGSMGCVDAFYPKKLQKLGIKCHKFAPFVPIISNVHNNRDHRKITVIDGKIGYTGGINLADEYVNINAPFGHWKDTAVRLEGEGVKGLLLMFLKLYNLSSKEPVEEFSPYIPKTYEKFEGQGFVQPYGSGPRPVYSRSVGEDVYINIVNTARRYVWFMTPYLIIDYRLREALVLAAERGVDVRLIVPHIPDKKVAFALTRSNYMALIRGGVKIYEYTPGFVHAKGVLSDDKAAVVGTINLDYRSFIHHYENAVFMFETSAVSQIKEDMLRTIEASSLQTEEDARKNVVWRWVCQLARLFAPLF